MSNMRGILLTGLATLCVLTGGLLLDAGATFAAVTHDYTGHSFGPQGLGGSNFENVQGIAVNQSTGDVYVDDVGAAGGSIYKFDSTGEPVDFSGSATNVITAVGGGGADENEIAVDSTTSGPAKGDIYVANNSEVRVYDGSTGKLIESLPGGEPCGIAVDPSGDLYVGIYPSTVDKYEPAGIPLALGPIVSSLSSLPSICHIAVDLLGNLYAGAFPEGLLSKYEASQFNTKEEPAVLALSDANASAFAVDPFTDDVYLDGSGNITQYDSSGHLLGTSVEPGPGAIEGSFGIGVQPSGHAVYASNGSGRVNIYGPGVVDADVTSAAVSNLTSDSATLNGSVNPAGELVTSCQFEYGTDTAYASAPVSCAPSPGSGLSPVAVTAEVSHLLVGTLYHYRLTATDANGTSHTSDGTFTTLPTVPTLTDGPLSASDITRTTALLSGTINPNGAATAYHFIYGTTTSYGQSSSTAEAGAGTADVSVVPISIAELTPNTTYHYALAASNQAGETVGPDYTLTTTALTPPAVSTGTATGVTQTSATLTGTIETAGLKTFYGFQVGTEAGSYGPLIPAGSDTLAQALALTFENLQPGSLYHYRVYATNQDGTAYGTDETFTTLGVPAAIAQPVALPLITTAMLAFPTEAKVRTTTPRALTNAQKLAAALKACGKKARGKRAACRKQARKRYATAGKVKKK